MDEFRRDVLERISLVLSNHLDLRVKIVKVAILTSIQIYDGVLHLEKRHRGGQGQGVTEKQGLHLIHLKFKIPVASFPIGMWIMGSEENLDYTY